MKEFNAFDVSGFDTKSLSRSLLWSVSSAALFTQPRVSNILNQNDFQFDWLEGDELSKAQNSACGIMSLYYAMDILNIGAWKLDSRFQHLFEDYKNFVFNNFTFVSPLDGKTKTYPNKWDSWWNHYFLLEHARERWYQWYPLDIKSGDKAKQVLLKILWKSQQDQNVITRKKAPWVVFLVSIDSSLERDFSDGHLVCITSMDDRFVWYYDPNTWGTSYILFEYFFEKMSNGKIVVLYSHDTCNDFNPRWSDSWWRDEMNRLLGAKPLRIVESWNKESNIALIGVHSDKPYYDDVHQKSESDFYWLSLVQWWERFIRFKYDISWSELPVWVRLDPNRIFTEEWIASSFKVLNWHLTDKEKQEILPKVLKSCEWLASNILERIWDRTVIALHNNRSRAGNFTINDQESWCDRYVNPEMHESTFIITNNSDIFSDLKDREINSIYVNSEHGEDDTWLLWVAIRKSQPYVNIEVSMDDRDEEARLLEAVMKVVKKLQN